MLKEIYHRVTPKRIQKMLGTIHYNYRYKRDVDAFLGKYDINHPTLFSAVEIETLNRCNGKCSFCPVNANQPQRKYAKMNEDLFHKIIGELVDMGYDQKISLYSNNEPFLDNRIIEWEKYLKERLPQAYNQLYTNGSLLTTGILEKVMPYLDELIIDNYDDELNINSNLEPVMEWCGKNEFGKKVHLAMRLQNEILTSRGGMPQTRKKKSKCRTLDAFSHSINWSSDRMERSACAAMTHWENGRLAI